ncbi:hypothetical protein AVEN_181822-1 [Araneus ventricosus]|uniref:CRAL/TRIO N-terminal domain-containing protein n=1 Tax=Araneus ventricosus TaxID=182803 RepID=A0A4Y2U2B5_ARAVE|nr:hypothetical protein AVEN_181822-1 [Araneus ventricosus]
MTRTSSELAHPSPSFRTTPAGLAFERIIIALCKLPDFSNVSICVQMNKSSSDFMLYDVADINDPLLSEQLKEINETEETRCRCLAVLRRDLKNLKDIEACLEEDFLLRFLRVSKYDTSKALQRVLKYYQNFEIYLDVFKKISFPLHKAESIQHLKLGPYRCRDKSFLVFAKPAIDYKKFTFAHRFYLEILALHQVLEDPVNQICGGTYIIDHEGMDIHGFLAFTPFWVRLFVDSLVYSKYTIISNEMSQQNFLKIEKLYNLMMPLYSKTAQLGNAVEAIESEIVLQLF